MKTMASCKDLQLVAEETELTTTNQYIHLLNRNPIATRYLAVHFVVHADYPPELKAVYNFVTRRFHAPNVTLGRAANNLMLKVDCKYSLKKN